MEKTNILSKISDILRVYHFRITRNTIYIFHLNFLEFFYILPVSFESLEILIIRLSLFSYSLKESK